MTCNSAIINIFCLFNDKCAIRYCLRSPSEQFPLTMINLIYNESIYQMSLYSLVHPPNKYLGTILGWRILWLKGSRICYCRIKIILRWRHLSFWNSLLALKAKPPKRIEKELNCHKTPSWEQLISTTPRHKTVIKLSYLPSILLMVHLSFQKVICFSLSAPFPFSSKFPSVLCSTPLKWYMKAVQKKMQP